VTVPGVTPAVAVDPIAHVDELFYNDELGGAPFRAIDPREVYQDQVTLALRVVDICSADACADSSTQCELERRTIGRDPHGLIIQSEQRNIAFQVYSHLTVVDRIDCESRRGRL